MNFFPGNPADFSGELQLPAQLKVPIERDLPQEGIEWKRPYRRQIKTVYLEARFERSPTNGSGAADPPVEQDRRWLEKQLLHTYWIECYDIEQYRQQLRDDLLAWVQRQAKHATSEWLVVLIDSSERRSSKSKLLPRSSVLDKIKADFPAPIKAVIDRHIVILNDPLKSDPKSLDSYAQFLNKLRTLLLSAYSKQLVRWAFTISIPRTKRLSDQQSL